MTSEVGYYVAIRLINPEAMALCHVYYVSCEIESLILIRRRDGGIFG